MVTVIPSSSTTTYDLAVCNFHQITKNNTLIISFPHIIQTYSIAVIMIGLITHSSIALRNKLWIIVKEQQRKIHKSILLHLLQPPFAEERQSHIISKQTLVQGDFCCLPASSFIGEVQYGQSRLNTQDQQQQKLLINLHSTHKQKM